MAQRYEPPLNQQSTPPPPAGGGGFWTSLPGILTASATLIASIGGLVGALFAAGVIGGSGNDGQTPAVNTLPTATVQVQAQPTANVFVATPTATTVPVSQAAPSGVDINGFWVSQGGFSWQIFQTGQDIEIASLDIIGTSYFGTRTGDSIRITQVSDGFSVVPSTGSMELQAGGDVINVVINGVPDIMVRQ